jgi:phospholipid/cholesterol/gamma-HCH transport system substrate-binding protein
MSEPSKSPRTRVIVFLVGAFGVLALTIAMLGRTHNLFSRKVVLYTTFTNVSGLTVGAPVRLAGVDVGMVRKIAFFRDKDKEVETVRVEMAVDSSALEHVRADSVAQLASKGLLGDMLINITIGDAAQAELKDGDFITPQEAAGLSQVIESVQVAIANVKNLTTVVTKRVEEVMTPEFGRNVGRIVGSAAAIAERVERGPGTAHALIYEKQLSEDFSAAIASTQGAVANVQKAVAHVEQILAEAEHGDGMLHALIYEKGGGKTVHELERVAKELADTVEQIRTGNGMIHTLIYEKDRSNLVQDLAQAAKIVRNVAEEVSQGKGTVGGLLKDPTVYQDLKTVLGNIKRNLLLKAVIRMTIEKDELKKTGATQE